MQLPILRDGLLLLTIRRLLPAGLDRRCLRHWSSSIKCKKQALNVNIKHALCWLVFRAIGKPLTPTALPSSIKTFERTGRLEQRRLCFNQLSNACTRRPSAKFQVSASYQDRDASPS